MARSRRLTLFRRTALALAACAVLPSAAQARVVAGATLEASDAAAKTYAPAYGFGYAQSAAASSGTYGYRHALPQDVARSAVAPHGPLVVHRSNLVLQPNGRLIERPSAAADVSGPSLRVIGTSEPVVASAASNGFDWTDAGIGAGVALVSGALLALLAVVAIRGRTGRGGLASA
jgi:hypothetical protein